jgi:hypothetical protein
MKLIQIALFVFITNLFGQHDKDLYITYNNENLKKCVFSSDKNTTIEVFQLQIQTKSPNQYILGFNKSGTIEVQQLISATPLPSFKFTYLNKDGDNEEREVSEKEVKNVLEFDEITKLTDAENFYETLTKFENIYFIYLKNGSSKVMAKKVKFERVRGL